MNKLAPSHFCLIFCVALNGCTSISVDNGNVPVHVESNTSSRYLVTDNTAQAIYGHLRPYALDALECDEIDKLYAVPYPGKKSKYLTKKEQDKWSSTWAFTGCNGFAIFNTDQYQVISESVKKDDSFAVKSGYPCGPGGSGIIIKLRKFQKHCKSTQQVYLENIDKIGKEQTLR